MILVIANIEVVDERTGREEYVTSHGYNLDTCETLILPPVHPTELGAVMDIGLMEWVIKGDRSD